MSQIIWNIILFNLDQSADWRLSGASIFLCTFVRTNWAGQCLVHQQNSSSSKSVQPIAFSREHLTASTLDDIQQRIASNYHSLYRPAAWSADGNGTRAHWKTTHMNCAQSEQINLRSKQMVQPNNRSPHLVILLQICHSIEWFCKIIKNDFQTIFEPRKRESSKL